MNLLEKILVLLGFMGTGKSSVGEKLAKKLSSNVIDTDELVEEKAGMTINEIFSQYGEDYFRQLETKVLKEVFERPGNIISTGGGIVLKEENWQLFKNNINVITVSLMAKPENIYERVKGDDTRPLLKVKDPYQKICSLLEERKDLYKKADYIIWTDNLTAEEIAKKIIEKTGKS